MIKTNNKNKHTKKNQFIPNTPEIRYIDPIYVAYIKGEAKSFKQKDLDEVVNHLLDTLYTQLTEAGIIAGATSFSIIEEKKVDGKRCIDVTVAFLVGKDVKSTEFFDVMEFPGTMAAVDVHYGNGSTSSSWSNLCNFTLEKGYKNYGTYREYYIVSTPNPAEFWTTELQLPLKE